ncbi:nucleotidyltransferase family protein [Candidatus Palauibacter sp.]|uniref:nucleotidyltransferase family protein n=1 Tax=Candidatus Palauibacter sp. TaxID=3101350 RepID=UPI003B5B328A
MSEERGVAGIVLAAGSSTRMGRNKLLLDVDGETLVRRAVRLAVEVGLDPVILVTGRFREAVEREVDDLDCAPTFNPDHETGIQTSVACGVAAVPADSGAAVVMLPDMPFVTAPMVRTLVERYAETDAPLVVSRYGEVNAPPILYGRGLFGEISRMRAGCGREVVRRHHERAIHVDWPAERLRDLDRPDEYESVRRELAGATAGDLP